MCGRPELRSPNSTEEIQKMSQNALRRIRSNQMDPRRLALCEDGWIGNVPPERQHRVTVRLSLYHRGRYVLINMGRYRALLFHYSFEYVHFSPSSLQFRFSPIQQFCIAAYGLSKSNMPPIRRVKALRWPNMRKFRSNQLTCL